MKKFLSACAVFFGCVQGALAADAVDSAPTYVAYDWSGFYLGVNGGYAWADTETSENSITTTGPLVGVGPGTFPPGNHLYRS
jgi:outer membrane immunogenic protein